MPVRVGSVMGSYDLFAKTIPGILFFIGLVTLSPSLPELPGDEIGIGGVTILIILTVISGFIIGQALHALAVAVETFCYKTATSIHSRVKWVGVEPWKKRTGLSGYLANEQPRRRRFTHKYIWRPLGMLIRGPVRVYCRVAKQMHAILIPHRVWFEYRLTEEFVNKEEPDGLYEWFKLQSRNHLKSMNIDLVNESEKVYRFVMSYLGIVKAGRARKFQATAAFCRSVWITTAIFGVIYLYLMYMSSSPWGYEPLVGSLLDEYGLIVPLSLLASSIPFMYSTGQYKKHFVEYIVVDFYNIVGGGANTSGLHIEANDLSIDVNN